MLNISHNQLNKKISLEEYSAYSVANKKHHYKFFNRFLVAISIVTIIVLFLPWTQNVTGNGYVTTLTPEQRPQTIQSPIPGKIEEWYVREGDFVQKGDTILRISEIKNEYQDPDLVNRIEAQVNAKSRSSESYLEKMKALEKQIGALYAERGLKKDQAKIKLNQAELKIVSDSIDLEATKTNLKIAERQYERVKKLEEEGLKAMTDLEEKSLKLQEMQAKLVSQQNKYLQSKNDLINAKVELNRLDAEYADKISKAQSELSSAISVQSETDAEVAKLQTQRSNYAIRNSLYVITAPQNGYINKAIRSGIGETFKEGEPLVGIMPSNYDLAVETFVEPIDLPLIHLGGNVRIQFDGWPAIFFSGWPNASYGTYAGKVVAIENFISSNGKFRVLIAPNDKEQKWPENVRIGSGAYTMALLDDVPIWFELWRQLNGFPPNYYTPNSEITEKK
ncbi:HlyD family secretion protein [Aegicerativicinus sediminis]|uniref:HlyD family secretion protein n=1 Tax=Aegicerativicinus sediminis TaxID=2893202 RepID=UPI001E4BC5F2|nr:biotin/lipoyl-binding protein [Aegicerativicinus sediminis]